MLFHNNFKAQTLWYLQATKPDSTAEKAEPSQDKSSSKKSVTVVTPKVKVEQSPKPDTPGKKDPEKKEVSEKKGIRKT